MNPDAADVITSTGGRSSWSWPIGMSSWGEPEVALHLESRRVHEPIDGVRDPVVGPYLSDL